MLSGEDLAAARSRARLTQQQLADRLGVTLRTIGNWERAAVVPKGAESKVRDVLSAQLGDQPDPLQSVSDARLLAEIARRFERTKGEGEGHVPAAKSRAAGSAALPSTDLAWAPGDTEIALDPRDLRVDEDEHQGQYGVAARRGRRQSTDEPGDGA